MPVFVHLILHSMLAKWHPERIVLMRMIKHSIACRSLLDSMGHVSQNE
jgi:hypothetical protein